MRNRETFKSTIGHVPQIAAYIVVITEPNILIILSFVTDDIIMEITMSAVPLYPSISNRTSGLVMYSKICANIGATS